MSFLNYLNNARIDEADTFGELPHAWKKVLTARYRNEKVLGAGSKLVQTSKRIDTDKRLNTELNKAVNVLARKDGYAVLESNGTPVALILSSDYASTEKRFAIYYTATQATTKTSGRATRANGWNPEQYKTTSFKYADARNEIEAAVIKMLKDGYSDGDLDELNLVIKSIEVDEDRVATQKERAGNALAKDSDLYDNRRKAIKRYTKEAAEKVTADLKASLPDFSDIDKAMEDALSGKTFSVKKLDELEDKIQSYVELLRSFAREYSSVGKGDYSKAPVKFSASGKKSWYTNYLTDAAKKINAQHDKE